MNFQTSSDYPELTWGWESSNFCWCYTCVSPLPQRSSMSSEYLWWLCRWIRNFV